MSLIKIGELFSRSIAIVISRIVPVGIVRAIHVAIAMGVSAWGTRGLMNALKDATPEGTVANPQNIQEILGALPQEQVMDLVFAPQMWIAVVVNIIIFLWAQGAAYLALYPHPKNPGAGEPRALPGILLGAVGLMFPLIIVNICYAALTMVGLALLLVPGVWLAVKYSFAPLLLVTEGQSAFASFSRSSELVSGSWMGLFGRLLVCGVVAIVGNMLLSFIPVVGPIAAQLLFPPFVMAWQIVLFENLKEMKGSSVETAA
ncbi:MAG: hypothetical protein HYT79_07990 [Elusimicrobia bacterium]|nr:hypothetical protein [Elusimicrobiota bacterium]